MHKKTKRHGGIMEFVVGIGEIKVTKNNGTLVALGLGSCICVALYDTKNRIGGLAHILLPYSSEDSRNPKYANHAIPTLIEEMRKMGAKRENIVAKISGGAQIFKHMTLEFLKIGEKNIKAVREILKKLNIRIVAEDVGGTRGRNVYFFVSNGKLLVRYSNGENVWI